MTGPLLLLAAYLLGSVPTGLWVVRAVLGVDVRQLGSGNTGTTNVYRVAGPWVGAVVLLLDAAKGALPVLASGALGLGAGWTVAAGLSSVVGHNWSVFLGFRGGKGVATSLGALTALSPTAAAVAVVVWGTAVVVTRYASVGSLLAMLSVPVTLLARGEPGAHVALGAALAALGIWRHRSNLRRLREGTELKVTDRPSGPGGRDVRA
ncbi:MAG: glycerol-3-phosphate 1-O-acyltransferase PlsY [Armatimonadota bacterium]|nr:glycerol-3-phosphate 1-O-acyltransferase PlsY [Armatimonadota bacterium]MDW8156174.1 glycerol-3-phosphate 1-O-acyltransferase PlsY [Armatimonadota bacterium]